MSFNEAQKALMLAHSVDAPDFVHYYDDLAIYDLLTNVKNSYRIHPGLSKLIEYDSENGTNYVTTLAVYLRNYKNLSQTADDLFCIAIQSFIASKKLKRYCRQAWTTTASVSNLSLEF